MVFISTLVPVMIPSPAPHSVISYVLEQVMTPLMLAKEMTSFERVPAVIGSPSALAMTLFI